MVDLRVVTRKKSDNPTNNWHGRRGRDVDLRHVMVNNLVV